jgi:hypothetical protein
MSKRDKINDCRSNYLDLVIILYHNFNKNTRNFFPRWDDERIRMSLFVKKIFYFFNAERIFNFLE